MNYFPVGQKLPCIYEGEPKLVKGFNIFYVTEDRYAFSSNITCVFLNNKVHVFNVSTSNNQAHKIYEGKECRMMNKTPYGLSCAFVFHDKLYIAGNKYSNTSGIWKYNESDDTWTQITTVSCYDIGIGVAITRDEVHFFGGRPNSDTSSYTLHYKFDGTTITQLNYLPYSGSDCKALTDSVGTIHIFGLYESSGRGYKEHYIYTSDGVFTKTDSPILYDINYLTFAWANGAIHAIGNSGINDLEAWKDNHYIWTLDNQQWTKVEDIPFIDAHYATATSHSDIIDVISSAGHCKKILGQWYNQSPSPYVIPIFN